MKIRASSGYQAFLCPGSVIAQDGLSDASENQVQVSGTRVHAADAGEDIDLTDDEEGTLETVQEKRQRLRLPLVEGFDSVEIIRERLYEDDKFSGHPDYVEILDYVGTCRALIFDSKTGWKEQTAPESNLQVRIYAFLVFKAHPNVDEIYAGLIPSRFKTPPPVLYERADMPAIEENLNAIYAEAMKQNAERNPSPVACRYCKSRATDRCKETIPMNTQLAKLPVESLLKTLTPEQKGLLLDECALIEGNIKIARERLREELDSNPASVEGWQLKPGASVGKINDADKCYQAVSNMLELDEFQACLSVKKKPLETALKAHLLAADKIKGKEADSLIKEILSPVTVFTQNKPSLEKKP